MASIFGLKVFWQNFVWVLLAAVCLVLSAGSAEAVKNPSLIESDIDPELFSIDEKVYLGVRPNMATPMINDSGETFKLGDRLGQAGANPMVLVLGYYQCDGTCSVINTDLNTLLDGVNRLEIGRDFSVLTLAFDANDTMETLVEFKEHLHLPAERMAGWDFALFANPEDIEPFTSNLGFKFFWSPRDRTFFHPGVYMVLSPEGRVTRFLYALNTEPEDLQLALLEAAQGQMRATPKDLINFAVSLCYSYNYAEGRYTLNIPLFVGVGSLFLGIILFAGASITYARRRSREATCQGGNV